MSKVDGAGPLAATPTRNFGYDAAGNTTSRSTETGVVQTLAWDKENHLSTVTENSATVASYLYDSSGARLHGTATVGTTTTTTLYLPDGTELEKTASGGPVLAQRYIGGVAVRNTSSGLKWIIPNHQGTGASQIDAASLTISQRRMMPYGEPRGTQPSWLGAKGYVGGTKDTPTGLTHLGAREYDPSLGRFISVDPIMDLADPQQWNGYAYSGNNPTTWADPSGLMRDSKENFTGGNAACGSYIACGGTTTNCEGGCTTTLPGGTQFTTVSGGDGGASEYCVNGVCVDARNIGGNGAWSMALNVDNNLSKFRSKTAGATGFGIDPYWTMIMMSVGCWNVDCGDIPQQLHAVTVAIMYERTHPTETLAPGPSGTVILAMGPGGGGDDSRRGGPRQHAGNLVIDPKTGLGKVPTGTRISKQAAKELAEALGYSRVPNQKSHGEDVYVNRGASRELRYISADGRADNGGVFKAAKSVDALGLKTTRSGTYGMLYSVSESGVTLRGLTWIGD